MAADGNVATDTRLGADIYGYAPARDAAIVPAGVIPLRAIHAVACMQPDLSTLAVAPPGAAASEASESDDDDGDGDGGDDEEVGGDDDGSEKEEEEEQQPAPCHYVFWQRLGGGSFELAYRNWHRLVSPQSAMDFYYDDVKLDDDGKQADPFAPTSFELASWIGRSQLAE